MTTYYVGPGGNNANSGLSWANRKLTLNDTEDIPVAAGDIVYVGPGTYRETLTVDVSGSSGNPITYIADVTGQNTDGVGGVVRITGSNDDQSVTRANAILATGKNYRTFRGFVMDTTTSNLIVTTSGCTNWIVEDCQFYYAGATAISISGTSASWTIRRCRIEVGRASSNINCITVTHTSTVNDIGILIENCLVDGRGAGDCITSSRVGGITIRNCTISGGASGVKVSTALAAGQTVTVNNCLIHLCTTGLNATVTGEITEDYNNVFNNGSARANTSTGANSTAYPVLMATMMLSSGFFSDHRAGLSPYSLLLGKAGTGEATDDLFGQSRPATSSKKSWGAVQFGQPARDTSTVRTGSTSIELADARRHQIIVPVTNASTTISVYARWETDYAGTKPQMVIKQPGQSDTTVTAAGSSGSWEQLTTTLTPAATPGFVVVELVSNNTATSGSYATYFDDLIVTGLVAATNFDALWLTDTQRGNAYMQTPAGGVSRGVIL